LFGATLTGNELRNYQEFTAKKSYQPKVVSNMIQDQIDYTLDTAGQRRRSFESAGYRLPENQPVDFTTTYGNAPTVGGGATQDRYVTGKVYTDESGNKAKYLGNGNWEDQ
jgi:hypothetical protein